MENTNVPNLFSFATKELSQDAFICWLVSWGDKKYEIIDSNLHRLGKNLIDEFLLKHGKKIEIDSVEVEAQTKEKIDIFIKINHGEYYILIEDKTHSNVHDNQLETYLEKKEIQLGKSKIIPIYLKTGDFDKFEHSQFKLFERKDFLEILNNYLNYCPVNEVNTIVSQFHQYWHSFDLARKNFENKEISNWGNEDWIGFYKVLLDELKFGGWSYVANQTGGFWAFYWEMDNKLYFNNSIPFSPYIQIQYNLETDKKGTIAFRINIDEKYKDYYSEIRGHWSKKLIDINDEILKPVRFGSGKTMTCGRLELFESEKFQFENIVRKIEKVNIQFTELVKSETKNEYL